MSNQNHIDLIRIRAAAKDIDSLLDAALSNASGNPEFDSVSRRVRGFREAVLCLPESEPAEPTDSQLLDWLEKESTGQYTEIYLHGPSADFQLTFCKDGLKLAGFGKTLRAAMLDAIKNS